MNISSSFQIRGYQSISCGTFEQLNLQSSFGYSFLSNPRSVSNICSRKKLITSSNHGFNSAEIHEGFNSVCMLKVSRGTFKTACQGNDSIPFINGNGRDVEPVDTKNVESSNEETKNDSKDKGEEAEAVALTLDELKALLQKALKELEIAQLNSTMFEDKAQRISEAAIALKDKALNAWDDVNLALLAIEEILKEEGPIKESIKRAKMALSLAEARHQVALESFEDGKEKNGSENESSNLLKEEETLLASQKDMKECRAKLEDCEKALTRLQNRKDELQKEVVMLNDLAEKAQTDALKAEEDVANIMLLAEEAVAFELEALKRVNDAEIALQKAEKVLATSVMDTSESTVLDGETLGDENALEGDSVKVIADKDSDATIEDPLSGPIQDNGSTFLGYMSDDSRFSDDNDKGNAQTSKDKSDIEKTKNVVQPKKQETQKDFTKDSSPLASPKSLLMKSSRFFSASFFSMEGDGTEFTPAAVFKELGESARKHLPKLLVWSLLIGASFAFYAKQERIGKIFQQPNIITTNLDEVSSNAQPIVRQIKKLPEKVKEIFEMLPHQEINEEEASLFDMLWLLLGSVIFVPIFQKLPGGSPVLGYLTAGILIGPYGLSIIRNVHETKAIAEFGVVFLMFNIGLELSVERLSSMKKYVFGLGSAQVLVTAVVVGLVVHFVCGQLGPAAIVIGNGLALSSTAVVLQVLQERGESTSRHGRATFSVLLFQGIMTPQLSSLLFLVVGISMALTPWLAAGGQFIASNFDQHDVRSLLPDESETDDLQDHIIICGFGRVGQIIAQLLSERLIPFVALDVRSKYFPNVKTFVRAHDVDHGLNLEKAGATAVVPETLEPSLQLASAVLAQAKLPMSEIAATINEFRSRHLSELTELSETSGSSLGYGFSRIMSKPKSSSDSSSDDNQISDGALAI
ncbi:hypothetical protein M8C21_020615 [Ambrosia artemisiifolia]|uniref:Cation/H+ exchanger transmembrane domain-containing protein n=1 Tax=Ambrosia artemisiifolia TaxID=4212 RepID=A0AAD5GDL9_AMBAR|nr:hypothetical protein M8C21_020615 [Ambrosia artemisiifolia]